MSDSSGRAPSALESPSASEQGGTGREEQMCINICYFLVLGCFLRSLLINCCGIFHLFLRIIGRFYPSIQTEVPLPLFFIELP